MFLDVGIGCTKYVIAQEEFESNEFIVGAIFYVFCPTYDLIIYGGPE